MTLRRRLQIYMDKRLSRSIEIMKVKEEINLTMKQLVKNGYSEIGFELLRILDEELERVKNKKISF